jgi:hypothetical protein
MEVSPALLEMEVIALHEVVSYTPYGRSPRIVPFV